MLVVRKLALLALAVCAMLAFSVSSASAAEVVDEATGDPCPDIVETHAGGVSGGCPLKGQSNDLELGGIFGVMNVCDVELEGAADHAGEAVGTYDIISCEAGSSQECTTEGNRHARAEVLAASGTDFTQESNFCVVAFGLTINCHVSGLLDELAAHNYALVYDHATKCENASSNSLSGTISLVVDEAHPPVEVR